MVSSVKYFDVALDEELSDHAGRPVPLFIIEVESIGVWQALAHGEQIPMRTTTQSHRASFIVDLLGTADTAGFPTPSDRKKNSITARTPLPTDGTPHDCEARLHFAAKLNSTRVATGDEESLRTLVSRCRKATSNSVQV